MDWFGVMQSGGIDLTQLGAGGIGGVVAALGLVYGILRIKNGKNGHGTAATLATLATQMTNVDKTLEELKRQLAVQWEKYDDVRDDVAVIKGRINACKACGEAT